MTPDDTRNVLSALLLTTEELTPREMKTILKILAVHKIYAVCPECKKPITDMNDFSWDHVWPKSRGGSDKLSNMLPMHKCCNEGKGKRIILSYLDDAYRISLYQDTAHKDFQSKPKHKSIKQTESKPCIRCCNGKGSR